MKYIASCSFGKDSLAQIILAKENNYPLDHVVYCEVMFTKEISGEIPEHADFIHNVAIPMLKERYGIETIVLRSERTMWDDFHTLKKRGPTKGMKRGFPIPSMCSVKRDLKLKPIEDYWKSIKEPVIQYVGIAYDEPIRLERLKGTNCFSILGELKVTEDQCLKICADHGLLSPIYSFTKRNGCFFCPNVRKSELLNLYNNHRDLWSMLLEMQGEENLSRKCFSFNKTLFEIEKELLK